MSYAPYMYIAYREAMELQATRSPIRPPLYKLKQIAEYRATYDATPR